MGAGGRQRGDGVTAFFFPEAGNGEDDVGRGEGAAVCCFRKKQGGLAVGRKGGGRLGLGGKVEQATAW